MFNIFHEKYSKIPRNRHLTNQQYQHTSFFENISYTPKFMLLKIK